MRMRSAMAALGAVAAMTSLLVSGESQASSHREAPFITKNPKVDGTDFYMFQSYEASRIGGGGVSDYTTIIANYIPLQDAYGGPNYFSFDPEALYEIHIENSGDAVEDITFQFQFKNALNPVTPKGVVLDVGGKQNSVPTIQANVARADNPAQTITAANADSFLNVQESYSINVVRGPRRGAAPQAVHHATTDVTTFKKPVDYIGSKTLGSAAAYKTYAESHIHPITIPGCDTPAKVFVGQRREGFRVNLGLIFDLVNVTALGGLPTIIDPGNRDALTGDTDYDNTLNKNVSTIAMEVPTKCLTADGLPPATSAKPILGGWTTASVRQARVINPKATYGRPAKEGGAWAQVSRLGMPLTNEVVIGIADKDRFNSSEPKDDTQFLDYVTNPTLPQILQAIFGGASTPVFPAATVARTDLVTIFLKGVPGVNENGGTAEMLRLNTKLPVKGAGNQNGGAYHQTNNIAAGLGAATCFPNVGGCTKADIAGCFTPATSLPANCDLAGFPNGRRPGDDVVDIELTVLLGYFIPKGTGAGQAPNGGTILHDAVINQENQFDGAFPYLKTPLSGSQ
jgi:hypothetical protein